MNSNLIKAPYSSEDPYQALPNGICRQDFIVYSATVYTIFFYLFEFED